jgi:hypothetical protein
MQLQERVRPITSTKLLKPDAFLHVMDERLKVLDEINVADLTNITSPSGWKVKPWSEEQILSITDIFNFLLMSPAEYIPRQHRSSFFRRALTADLSVWSSLVTNKQLVPSAVRASTRIRLWIAEMADAHSGLHFSVRRSLPNCFPLMSHLSRQIPHEKLLEYVLQTDSTLSLRPAGYLDVTLQLCEMLFK